MDERETDRHRRRATRSSCSSAGSRTGQTAATGDPRRRSPTTTGTTASPPCMLRDWLLERARAEARGAAVGGADRVVRAGSPRSAARSARRSRGDRGADRGAARGRARGPGRAATTSSAPRWLMAQLLDYHHREARPVWWVFFDRLEADPDELIDDADCDRRARPTTRGRRRASREALRLVHSCASRRRRRSWARARRSVDPADGKRPGEIVEIDAEAGWLELKRGPSLAGAARSRRR